MKQIIRKNKTNQVLNMPKTAYYTLRDLFDVNQHFNAEITIRVRLDVLRNDGKVVEIGWLTGGKGRPQKIFAQTPVTQTTLAKAKADNVSLVDNVDKLINVITVTSPTKTPSVIPTVVTSGICKS